MQTGVFTGVAQLITVLIIFIAVLFLTWFVTKWMANLQSQKSRHGSANIELIDTSSISADKYIQIIRITDKYVAIAVTKDQVSMLTELDEDAIIKGSGETEKAGSFEELFHKARRKKKNR